ncbi:hypothetical protein BU25DRAFT_406965 [Macroventuria anomochaeta]|uniref:Uncharacterized protein n=1 Tax=Macroventuria anomochaeta TaxID=301207 RepID=A0ACB6SDP3_9PLEO|nr:uncharacterized protein BU25DRAFT_406965 [Macroventuria anomochaeta]KAF2632436.1 hypothetical protein BU25DRAFT_406965 [Macroventuria anomochaeta]
MVASSGCSCRLLRACFGLVAWASSRFFQLGRCLGADGERATQLRNEGPFSTCCTTLDFKENFRDDSVPTAVSLLAKLRKIREQ